jgi:hypothetical protein
MSMPKKSMRKKLAIALALAVGASAVGAADAPRFGQPISTGDLAPWDISIGPDGIGLPPGSGTPAQGATVYAERGCALCHGRGIRKSFRLLLFHGSTCPLGRAGRSSQGCAFSRLGRFVVHQRGGADGGWRTDGRSLRSPPFFAADRRE